MRNDKHFLCTIARGMMPRHFESGTNDRIVYDEDMEVAEMYFIIHGNIGIGINQYGGTN